jgi:hypothetical protein
MTEGDPTEMLSEKDQYVLVVRLNVETNGQVRGELVDPVSQRRQRFVGLACLADALRVWVDDALRSTLRESGSRPKGSATDT